MPKHPLSVRGLSRLLKFNLWEVNLNSGGLIKDVGQKIHANMDDDLGVPRSRPCVLRPVRLKSLRNVHDINCRCNVIQSPCRGGFIRPGRMNSPLHGGEHNSLVILFHAHSLAWTASNKVLASPVAVPGVMTVMRDIMTLLRLSNFGFVM